MEDGDTTEEAVVVPVSIGDEQPFPHSLSRHRDSEEESPHETLRDTKASIENIVAEILSLKNQGKPKPLLTLRLRELLTQTFLHFVTLRQVPSLARVSFSIFRNATTRVSLFSGESLFLFFIGKMLIVS